MTTRAIVMDVSRLFARAGSAAPTGIDRVEWAYANHLLADHTGPVAFRRRRAGRLWPVSRARVLALVRRLEGRWIQGGGSLEALARRLDWPALAAVVRPDLGRGLPITPERPKARTLGTSPILLNVSHQTLDRPRILAAAKRRLGGPLAVLIHDLIPLEVPEYCRKGEAVRHHRRLRTVEHLADLVLVNSAATANRLRAAAPGLEDRGVPISVAWLWCEGVFRTAPNLSPPGRPYFLCTGTIEGRKNHTLLLSLWRRLSEELGEACPRLVLAGKRGWENDTAFALLERCPSLRGTVVEAGPVDDHTLAILMAHARALLMPSHAEGFGLPVLEALATGTPVIASDLPALREVGQGIPDYLDPLDGQAWRMAILRHAGPQDRGARPNARPQVHIPTRQDHLGQVFRRLETLQPIAPSAMC